MIGEMLGESRRLHTKAERYQPAAYQRQAAQRLLSQLTAELWPHHLAQGSAGNVVSGLDSTVLTVHNSQEVLTELQGPFLFKGRSTIPVVQEKSLWKTTMKPTEFIRSIIELAEAANRSCSQQNDDLDLSFLEAVNKSTEEEIALAKAFEEAKPALIYACIAVMYIGRGNIAKGTSFQAHDMQVRGRFRKPRYAVSQMMGKQHHLPKFLENGLKKLDQWRYDIDELIGNED